MSFEMSCPNCEGRMMVDALGIVVACPHCGTHLAIPAEIPNASEPPIAETPPAATDQNSESKESHSPGGMSDWIPLGHTEGSAPAYSDLSQTPSAEHDLAASESNVLVSEPDHETEPEVPSALRVDNPDPSAVRQAVIGNVKPTESTSAPSAQSEVVESHTAATETAATDAGSAPDFLMGETHHEAGFPQLTGISAADSAPGLNALDPTSSNPYGTDGPNPSLAEIGPSPRGYDSASSPRRGKVIPKPIFQLWLSYTILATAAAAFGIYNYVSPPTSNLESLPDVKPLEKNERKLVPEKAAMPRGHTLVFDQTQRFGNIEVTPVKVTQGELVLVGRDYVEESKRIQNAGTVLKLWLKFKNVSEDQTIVPLDNNLLFYRHKSKEHNTPDRANNFVCPANQKSEQGNLVLVYEDDEDDDYKLKDLPIGTELKPGEEIEVYIPTETHGWDKLQGPLIWRVHFRKGYSPKNYGVTTVIEVAFPSDAIETETTSA